MLEMLTYGVVGGSAWITQSIVYFVLIHVKCYPAPAMMLGNFMGMLVAYGGHVRFTFKRTHRFSRSEFIKFMITSLIGLGINILGVRIVTHNLHLHPKYAIIPTMLTPLITYLISKFWTFT